MTRTRRTHRATAATGPTALRPRPSVQVVAVAALVAVLALLAGCSNPSSSSSSTTTSTVDVGGSTTTTEPAAESIVFTTVESNIDAYLPTDPFTRQRVVAAGTGPAGTSPHGQICFDSNGSRRFVVAETRTPHAGTPPVASAGWGLYQLSGSGIGEFEVHRITGWDSPSVPSADAPTTYGCTFLSTGQLLTTDVGNRQTGDATGQLIEYFPPFDAGVPASCTVAKAIASPLGLSSGPDDVVYLASSRAPTAGIWRYSGSFPTTAAACTTATVDPPATPGTTLPPPTTTTTIAGRGTTTTTTRPTTSTTPPKPAEPLVSTLFIPASPTGLSTPAGVSVAPSGKAVVVTSPIDGKILAFGIDGSPLQTVLEPTTGTTLGPATSFPGGTPFGVAVTPEGGIVYVDPGLVRDAKGTVGPGPQTGSLRIIETQNGSTAPPQDIDTGLDDPDGLGLYVPSGGGSAASKV